jgi:hypothetical protein
MTSPTTSADARLPNEVFVAITRGEGYEDVCDELLAEDALGLHGPFQWRIVPQEAQHAEAGAVAWEVVGKYPHLPGPETFFYYGAAGKVHADAHAAQGDIVRPLGYLHPAQPASQQGAIGEIVARPYGYGVEWLVSPAPVIGTKLYASQQPHPTGDKVRVTDEMVLRAAFAMCVDDHEDNASDWWADAQARDEYTRCATIALTAALDQEKGR